MSKKIVEQVFGPHMTSQIWTANYYPAYPFSLAGFELGAVFPAVLYMFRRGHRRGKGRFKDTFADSNERKPTISSVAERLKK